MVFSYHQIQEHPKLLLAMTGLTRTEFLQCLPHFQYAWEQLLAMTNQVEHKVRVKMAKTRKAA
jgi:hypothetical protein